MGVGTPGWLAVDCPLLTSPRAASTLSRRGERGLTSEWPGCSALDRGRHSRGRVASGVADFKGQKPRRVETLGWKAVSKPRIQHP